MGLQCSEGLGFHSQLFPSVLLWRGAGGRGEAGSWLGCLVKGGETAVGPRPTPGQAGLMCACPSLTPCAGSSPWRTPGASPPPQEPLPTPTHYSTQQGTQSQHKAGDILLAAPGGPAALGECNPTCLLGSCLEPRPGVVGKAAVPGAQASLQSSDSLFHPAPVLPAQSLKQTPFGSTWNTGTRCRCHQPEHRAQA